VALREDLVRGAQALRDGSASTDEADELERKAEEAEDIQAELDRFEAVERAAKNADRVARHVPNQMLPPMGGTTTQHKSIGELFTASNTYKQVAEGRTAHGVPSEPVYVPTPLRSETKAVNVAPGVIQADRDSRRVRLPEQERLTIRDILDVRTLNSSHVDYVTHGATEAAAPVAEGEVKPEADIDLDSATAPVRTIAVTTPISEQTLQDVDQVQDIINDELSHQVRMVEERQVLWGNGAGENLQGLFTLAGVPSITRGEAHLLDRIASGVTDVRMAGFEPNALVIHPLDWEQIIQLKATGGEYLHANAHVDPGNLRAWGMNVVVATSTKDPTGTTRNLLVGDFRRGATLYDRSTLAVQVGYVNDQFRRNKRTIRAEERVAFAIRSPLAFAKFETAA